MSINNFLRYSVSSFLGKGLSFISVPLFAYVLSPEEFGLYAIFLATLPLSNILSNLNLSSSVRQYEYKYSRNSENYIFSIFISSLFITFTYSMLLIWKSESVFSFLDLPKIFIWPFIVIAFLNIPVSIFEQYLLGRNNSKKHLKLNLVRTFSDILISIILVYTIEFSAFYRSLGHLTSYVFVFVVFIIPLFSYIIKKEIKFKKIYLYYGLGFSVPIIIHQLSHIVISLSDRIIIGKYLSKSDVGIYSFSYSISSILIVLIIALNSSVLKKYYEFIKEGKSLEINDFFKKINEIVIIIVLILSLVLINIFKFISPNDFQNGIDIIPIVFLNSLGFLNYIFFVNVSFFYSRTFLISIGSILAALINLTINIIFIEKYGITIAAISTTISYFTLGLIHYFLVKSKSSNVILSIKPYLLSLFITISLISISYIYPASTELNMLSFCYLIIIVFLLFKLKNWKKLLHFL